MRWSKFGKMCVAILSLYCQIYTRILVENEIIVIMHNNFIKYDYFAQLFPLLISIENLL